MHGRARDVVLGLELAHIGAQKQNIPFLFTPGCPLSFLDMPSLNPENLVSLDDIKWDPKQISRVQ